MEEFGKGALAVASLGGTAALERALKSGRLDGRSGALDVAQIYLEGVFNGVTFGFGDAFADSYAGQGRGIPESVGTALLSSLKNLSGYDDLKTIFADPHATAWDRAQAMSTLVAKWAGLAAVGVSGTRYANMPLRNPLARRPGSGPPAPGLPGIVDPAAGAPALSDVPGAYINRQLAVDMRAAPAGSATNAAGFARNGPWFWRQLLKEQPEMFDAVNAAKIRAGRAPVVNERWLQYNPAHKPFEGSRLIHHHMGQGPIATPVPEPVHRQHHSVFHPQTGRSGTQ